MTTSITTSRSFTPTHMDTLQPNWTRRNSAPTIQKPLSPRAFSSRSTLEVIPDTFVLPKPPPIFLHPLYVARNPEPLIFEDMGQGLPLDPEIHRFFDWVVGLQDPSADYGPWNEVCRLLLEREDSERHAAAMKQPSLVRGRNNRKVSRPITSRTLLKGE
ncbi:hypothetical protein BJ508DRAFT_414424 [Ascobolus immersus RN42]|uniref:Uncharacterized protein n=1 Tax=Ascobolus immersus RN42 TaxID=1160509 RepID=A0A3N4I785_ASCIM|nr:hypothetical protein BJ508DRAFT_414424 [Ascobolus immersus RN42]